jgi:hypothetical protein
MYFLGRIMRDEEVSPGFFWGVMGLVGAAVVKNPTAKVQSYKTEFSVTMEDLGGLIVGVFKFGLIVAGICLGFWCLHKVIRGSGNSIRTANN